MGYFKFIGQPEETNGIRQSRTSEGAIRREPFVVGKKGDGPDEVTKFGYTFTKDGDYVEVDESDKAGKRVAAKLRGSAHFVEDLKEKKGAPEESHKRGPGRPPGTSRRAQPPPTNEP